MSAMYGGTVVLLFFYSVGVFGSGLLVGFGLYESRLFPEASRHTRRILRRIPSASLLPRWHPCAMSE